MTEYECPTCGSPVTTGKQFCRNCGQALLQPTQKTTSCTDASSLPLSQPSGQFCKQCGASLIPGKRFCRSCGHAVAGEALCPAGVTQAPKDIPVKEASPLSPLQEEIPVANPSSTSEPEFTPRISTLPPQPENIITESHTSESMLAPSNTKKRRLTQPVMLVGICICILLLAGAVAGFYVYRGRTANKPIAAGNSPSAASSDANGPTQAQNKPSATTPINSQTAAQTAQPPQSSTPAPNANATVSHPTVAAAKSKSTDNPVPIQKASKPEDTQRPSQVSSTSGVLHYSGPPVRYGGTVVFSNLPAGRLKFSFDKQSWQPLISHQPDGTQKLILRSIKNEDQSQCDVRWELLQ